MTNLQGYFIWKNQVGDYVENNRVYQEQLLELKLLKERAANAGFVSLDLLEIRKTIIEYLQNSNILIMEDHWDETSLNSKLSLLGKEEDMADFLKWLSQKISPALMVKKLELISKQEGVKLDLVYALRDRVWLFAPEEQEVEGNKLLSFIWENSVQATSSEVISYQYKRYNNGDEIYSQDNMDESKINKNPDFITWLGYYHPSTQPYFLLKVYEEVLLFTPGLKKIVAEKECCLLLLPEPVLQIGNKLYKIKE